MSELVDDLERLAALLEKDLITREQFDQQRDALMSRGEAATAPPQEDMPPPIEEPLAPAPPHEDEAPSLEEAPAPPATTAPESATPPVSTPKSRRGLFIGVGIAAIVAVVVGLTVHHSQYSTSTILFQSVSAGDYHTCGVTSSSSVECWGNDSSGQATPPGVAFESVSAGAFHTCGVTSSGNVECWGNDDDGRSDPPSGTFQIVSAGDGTQAAWAA